MASLGSAPPVGCCHGEQGECGKRVQLGVRASQAVGLQGYLVAKVTTTCDVDVAMEMDCLAEAR